jgi:hypothetical protein
MIDVFAREVGQTTQLGGSDGLPINMQCKLAYEPLCNDLPAWQGQAAGY